MDFMTSWLGLEKLYTTVKDDNVYMLSSTLRDDMAAETRGLILDTFANGGTFGDLLTAAHSFLNKDLAQFYGFDSSALGHRLHARAVPGLDLARRRHPGAREHPDRLRARRHLVAHAARAPGAHAPLVPVREPAGRVARHHVPARPQPDDDARALRERARARRTARPATS